MQSNTCFSFASVYANVSLVKCFFKIWRYPAGENQFQKAPHYMASSLLLIDHRKYL